MSSAHTHYVLQLYKENVYKQLINRDHTFSW